MEEFRFLSISSPSLLSPTLSRFSISSLVSNYSAKSKILSSLISFMISLQEQALWTIVMKYLANLRGISSTGLSKMSMRTWVKALTRSFEHLIKAPLFISILLIISFKATRESTLLDRSPYFNWWMFLVISSICLSTSGSPKFSLVKNLRSSSSSSKMCY